MKKKILVVECIALFVLLILLFCTYAKNPTVYQVSETEDAFVLYVDGKMHTYQVTEAPICVETSKQRIRLVLPCGNSIDDAWNLDYPAGVLLKDSGVFLSEVSYGRETKVMYMQELHFRQLALADDERIMLTKTFPNGSECTIYIQFLAK